MLMTRHFDYLLSARTENQWLAGGYDLEIGQF